MEREKITETLRMQRKVFRAEPIDADIEPVRAYAKGIAELTKEKFSVIELPVDSEAFALGFRFASIPDVELPDYLSSGATLVLERKP
jgi:hypothetical protein